MEISTRTLFIILLLSALFACQGQPTIERTKEDVASASPSMAKRQPTIPAEDFTKKIDNQQEEILAEPQTPQEILQSLNGPLDESSSESNAAPTEQETELDKQIRLANESKDENERIRAAKYLLSESQDTPAGFTTAIDTSLDLANESSNFYIRYQAVKQLLNNIERIRFNDIERIENDDLSLKIEQAVDKFFRRCAGKEDRHFVAINDLWSIKGSIPDSELKLRVYWAEYFLFANAQDNSSIVESRLREVFIDLQKLVHDLGRIVEYESADEKILLEAASAVVLLDKRLLKRIDDYSFALKKFQYAYKESVLGLANLTKHSDTVKSFEAAKTIIQAQSPPYYDDNSFPYYSVLYSFDKSKPLEYALDALRTKADDTGDDYKTLFDIADNFLKASKSPLLESAVGKIKYDAIKYYSSCLESSDEGTRFKAAKAIIQAFSEPNFENGFTNMELDEVLKTLEPMHYHRHDPKSETLQLNAVSAILEICLSRKLSSIACRRAAYSLEQLSKFAIDAKVRKTAINKRDSLTQQ